MATESIWIEKFNQWKSIVKKGCSAGAGPGGIFCTWVGRNCNYNDCPRRSLEEIYVRPVDDPLELELRNKLKSAEDRIAELEKKLLEKTATIPDVLETPQEVENPDLIKELKKLENA